ncbi:MAG: HAD-IIIA family hydrolase [Ignavibacteria bacterium]|nr:HAD-IIIA family hydrolase [Ignavibacteria bacterium]
MRALFLDRDGVINRRIVAGYVTSPDDFVLIPEILPILSIGHERDYKLIVITNQQGVGKGLMSETDLTLIHQFMQELVHEKLGFYFDDIYYCADLESNNSSRRKPAPGMIFEAVAEHDININLSVFIGDSLSDGQTGSAAGIRTILIGDFEKESATWVVPTHLEALNIFSAL